MKNYGPDRAAKFTFLAEKTIFWYPVFECCRDHNFSSRITKFRVHSQYIYLTTAYKLLFYHTQGGGNFNLNSGLIFRWVYILSDFNVFNALNILNGLVLSFFNGLKSNGLEELMDQQLTEVTFVVTINV